jgi:hypothetical protein
MKKTFLAVLALSLVIGLAGGAGAHIGGKIYNWYEIADADLGGIDLRDGSIADWENVVGDPSLYATDFYADPTVGDGAQYDPADLDYKIWLGWNETGNHTYLAMERVDDVYVNEYAGGSAGDFWKYDSIEFMIDGDHTGGDYTGSADPNWTAEEQKLNNNRTAQQYLAMGDTPDGVNVGYLGAAADWVNKVPYADGWGKTVGQGPATTILEFYVTPFDDLVWNSPADSKATVLAPGKIMGFQISCPDWDVPGTYHAFHTLSGQAATWRYAERFVDGRLIGAGGGTAVENDSWGRIKASF